MDYLNSTSRYPKDYLEQCEYIKTQIFKHLKDYPNLTKVDLLDVSAGGVQVSGTHKEISGYYYVTANTLLEYDFSNADEVVFDFVKCWKCDDDPEKIRNFKDFIFQGKKYGWN